MKTTLDLPDDLLHRAKVVAAQRKTTLKELVGKIESCFHEQYIRLYGHIVKQASKKGEAVEITILKKCDFC